MSDRRLRGRRPGLVTSVVAALTVVVVAASGCTDDPVVELSAAGTEGKRLADRLTCANCHSANGDELTGPTWKDLFGASITLQGGGQVTVDDEYLTRAVREPNAQRREDATGQMPTFDEDRLTDAELASIIAYIEDLSAPQTAGE